MLDTLSLAIPSPRRDRDHRSLGRWKEQSRRCPGRTGRARFGLTAHRWERRSAAPTRRHWRGAVAYVEQEAFLFHDTIRNNLLFARPGASEAELEAALSAACANFVFDFADGIDTVVGDRGARLSGGERQRIALARALLMQPALIILDEATSALDEENESAILAALAKLRDRMAIVVIGHRPAMIEIADSVVLLEAGRIAWMGRPAELRDRTGIAA